MELSEMEQKNRKSMEPWNLGEACSLRWKELLLGPV